ncbi:MAG: MOSC domain-containing protein [Gammaproteobacteria bacterium]
MLTVAELTAHFPSSGELVWIGIRPARNEAMVELIEVMADEKLGLAGDRYQGGGTRQETLLQWEHLSVLTSLTSRPVTPELLRRNLVVKGINLLALKDRQFTIGQAVFQTTGLCHPCSRMEQTLGFGGYNAMRGHGGLTAVILEGGLIRLNDSVIALPKDADR